MYMSSRLSVFMVDRVRVSSCMCQVDLSLKKLICLCPFSMIGSMKNILIRNSYVLI